MNHITLTGNLGHAATHRTVTTPRGDKSGVNFSLAVRAGWGSAERTLWYDCSWWGERTEKVSAYLLKGTRVLVQGSPDVRTFPKKDGTTAAAITVNISELEFIGEKKPTSAEPARAASPPPSPPDPADVPF